MYFGVFFISVANKFSVKNREKLCSIKILFSHQIVSSSFCCDKFYISMFSHIFDSFFKNCITHQLKKSFSRLFFLLYFLDLCLNQYIVLAKHFD